ncbi:glycosyltransferase like family 2-domain-containing protein [Fimicolochytrium jonesii]|uniref:glycosyltransferase like family 2-domain-containing protein n=1 Tax=Fimicolochytrium jonesii TaxID=1396493 RepID=UPI0022FF3544|nr:glycosyltransferase like family 2-domain-containing protein [Fimicolochytrium jonesii]KAI8826753.1 glycosyltransferase like family 2-domain-containing protein [Fimicolochytrium jonesii]
MFYLTKETLPIYLPLGFIGIYRWFWFFVKILAYVLYKPRKPRRHPRYTASRDVTIIVPTIDSGDEIRIAIRTWLANDPFEIIFITIPSAQPALERLAREVDPDGRCVHVICVQKPNKRNQMVAGVNRVRTPITVFCDDDVIWPETMLTWMLAPFEDRMMGGVGTSQRVLPQHKYMTIWEILAAFRISLRNIEITATTYIDGGVCCLSGRTAAYRTCMLRDPDFQWSFTHEFWRGKYHQHSGDDKFLTRWVHSHNWKTYIQACPEAELESTFKDNWRFLKQLLRWTRNTWRSDTRSLFTERFVWTRHPFVAFTMLDKFFNPITLLAGPVTVVYLLIRSERDHVDDQPATWVILISYLSWLLITRVIKYMPHFVRRPQDVFVVPIWVLFNIYFAVMKVYCLFTLHVTDWGTRDGAEDGKGQGEEIDIYRPKWMHPAAGWGRSPYDDSDFNATEGESSHVTTIVAMEEGDGENIPPPPLPSRIERPTSSDLRRQPTIPRGSGRSSLDYRKNGMPPFTALPPPPPAHTREALVRQPSNQQDLHKPWMSPPPGTGGADSANSSVNLSIMTDYSPSRPVKGINGDKRSLSSSDSQRTIAMKDEDKLPPADVVMPVPPRRSPPNDIRESLWSVVDISKAPDGAQDSRRN